MPILWVLEWSFPSLGLSILQKTSLYCLFLIKVMPICFRGQDNLLGGQFWAMDIFILLGGQSNLLGVGEYYQSSSRSKQG